ncbi:hypothetical protein [Actinoplanes sp. N902-109]|uniref:hypothetical protein n=1 Tax=Actinoplanes sp. (strain N902-109) TaxID=649831 RepID=UPI00032951D4|nr:hypothetical protein [Actinoplanes sp. N902-109]AGL20964.1 hypothetical protein L083_7454 [Actinoplanes sp. N902-109]
MTTDRRDLLRRGADRAGTYDVYERSLATARRTRLVTAAVWVILLAIVAVAVPVLPRTRPDDSGRRSP